MLAYAGPIRSTRIEALEINEELSAALRLSCRHQSKAHLVLEFGDKLPPVTTNRFQLRQVVTNNPQRARRDEGTRGTLATAYRIGVARYADRPASREADEGGYLKVTVNDTGTGIRPESTRAAIQAVSTQRSRARNGPGRSCGHRTGARRLARCRPSVDAGN